jgi:hypothetical protein
MSYYMKTDPKEYSLDQLMAHPQMRKMGIAMHKKAKEVLTPLNSDELDNYCWEKLRSNDEDHDEKEIKATFRYYRNMNKENPVKLRMEWLKWNSPVGDYE